VSNKAETFATTAAADTNAGYGHGISFGEAARTWARIAALSFGGPAGQIAVMHRILVEEKRWIGEYRFLHALNYCMLLPGPEAHQLAVYIGWLMHRTWGGIVAGALFILPGLASLGVLSWVYASYGGVGIVQGLFFGLKAAVLAVVLEAVLRVGRRALKSPALVIVAAVAFVAIFFFAVPFPLIIAAAGLCGWLLGRFGKRYLAPLRGHAPDRATDGPPALLDAALAREIPPHLRPSLRRLAGIAAIGGLLWLGPVALLLAWLGPQNVFTAIAVFNSKMAVVTFGGAYAVLAYMAQQAVETYGWLRPDEMLVGLGFAETTPGPLISVVQFVGFMAAFRDPGALDPVVAGTLGGFLAMWTTFVPSFLWIFLGAPYVEMALGNERLQTALSAITAAVVGVILNLAIWFALHTLFGTVNEIRYGGALLQVPAFASVNAAALAIALVAIAAMFWLRIGMLTTLAVCSGLGSVVYVLSGRI
jgi:chromate transporter